MENRLKYEDLQDYDGLKAKLNEMSSTIRQLKNRMVAKNVTKKHKNDLKHQIQVLDEKIKSYIDETTNNLTTIEKSSHFTPLSKQYYEL